MINNTQKAFLELVKAGLWGNGNLDIRIEGTADWQEVYRLATEQSVLGLVLAGLEHSDVKPPQLMLLQWIWEVQVIEQRNKEMNAFVADLIEKLRKADIYTLLVKGQGIAQCYERPLWRSSGDVDFLFSDSNYEKAKSFLIPQASSVEKEGVAAKHLGMKIDSWEVELHGTMRSNCLAKMDKEIDAVLFDVFYGGNVTSWMNGNTKVFKPRADEDVFIVFTHILKHFFHKFDIAFAHHPPLGERISQGHYPQRFAGFQFIYRLFRFYHSCLSDLRLVLKPYLKYSRQSKKNMMNSHCKLRMDIRLCADHNRPVFCVTQLTNKKIEKNQLLS